MIIHRALIANLRNMPPLFHADIQVMPRPNRNPRSWAQRRYSSFFHGESVVTSARSGTSSHTRKPSTTSQRSCRMRTEGSASVLRSHMSTRSLIDPSASPTSTYRPISPDTFEHLQRRTTPPPLAHFRPQRTSSELHRAERHLVRAIDRTRRRQARHCSREQKGKRTCLPNIRNPEIRVKIFGSLISATTLAILFIICTPPPIPPRSRSYTYLQQMLPLLSRIPSKAKRGM